MARDYETAFVHKESAEQIRIRAARCDSRAAAAERDTDISDAVKWRAKALELRRIARDKEFSA